MPLLASYDLLDATLDLFEEDDVALWTPTSLSGGTAIWLDANTHAGTADGTAMAQWNDTSGNAKHATQSSGSLKPLFKTGIQNSLPVFRFDGTDDLMTTPSSGIASLPFSFFGVYKVSNLVCRIWDGATGSHTNCNKNTSFEMAGGTIIYGVGNTSFNLHSCIFGSGAGNSYGALNGTAVADMTANAATPNVVFTIGADHGAASLWTQGDLAELIWINGAVSSTDRDKIEGYLAWKWGLQASLPGGHAYASAAPTVPGGKSGLRYAISGGLRQRTLP